MSSENPGVPDERGYVEAEVVGTPQQPSLPSVVPPPVMSPPTAPGVILLSSGKAVAALILGIFSCLLFCLCGGVISLACGITAVILGSQARSEMLTGRFDKGNLGIAKAGWVCGVVGSCLAGLNLAVTLIAIFMHAARNF
jgi:hypothetical protein